jgi:hypothetical protein
MKRKRIGYYNQGSYFCHKCKKRHNSGSLIGKKHSRYASKAIKREAFLRYGKEVL